MIVTKFDWLPAGNCTCAEARDRCWRYTECTWRGEWWEIRRSTYLFICASGVLAAWHGWHCWFKSLDVFAVLSWMAALPTQRNVTCRNVRMLRFIKSVLKIRVMQRNAGKFEQAACTAEAYICSQIRWTAYFLFNVTVESVSVMLLHCGLKLRIPRRNMQQNLVSTRCCVERTRLKLFSVYPFAAF